MEIKGNISQLVLEEDLIASHVRKDRAFSLKEIEKNIKGSTDAVVLNMQACQNIDSIGVTFIVDIYKLSIERNMAFEVEGANEEIRQLFALMNLESFFS